jgi:hypothetical protein
VREREREREREKINAKAPPLWLKFLGKDNMDFI